MYVILLDGEIIYAATSEIRFMHELAQYAGVTNVRWDFVKSQAK